MSKRKILRGKTKVTRSDADSGQRLSLNKSPNRCDSYKLDPQELQIGGTFQTFVLHGDCFLLLDSPNMANVLAQADFAVKRQQITASNIGHPRCFAGAAIGANWFERERSFKLTYFARKPSPRLMIWFLLIKSADFPFHRAGFTPVTCATSSYDVEE